MRRLPSLVLSVIFLLAVASSGWIYHFVVKERSGTHVTTSLLIGNSPAMPRSYSRIPSTGIPLRGIRFWIRDDTPSSESADIAVSGYGGTKTFGLIFELVHPNGEIITKAPVELSMVNSTGIYLVTAELERDAPKLEIGNAQEAFGNLPANYPTIRILAGLSK